METPRDEQLIADLHALRPTPRPQFTAELDERAAAGFPRRSRLPRFDLDRLRAVKPRRLLIPAGGIAVIALALTTAFVAMNEEKRSSLNISTGGDAEVREARPKTRNFNGSGRLEGAPSALPSQASEGASAEESSAAEATPEVMFSDEAAVRSGAQGEAGSKRFETSFNPRNRAVERNAELVLGAAPADVADDASKVFEAVHAHDGIVLRSSTREGEAGVAGARFELLIPSGKLGDALAALSAIDEVRSRHEATNDITAPTVTTGELLQDSKARVDSLLAQLAAAETESEREAVESELAQERRHRARLRAQLQHLERRADFSRVLVRIESGDPARSSDEGGWGIGDALDDAGQILAVAAAVAVVALAILGPIALIALLAWLAHRAWIRRERRRVLS